ncbi:hypothetical protein B0H19DRAFT_1103694 [Mycena capillaripes]|nr:hypothetical protein B0H19DRAFT_1103694 [Mycena capillaripes]
MVGAVEADRNRLAELEAQILDLECAVSALKNEKALVQERLNSYKYPVLTLPNEIISEIFLHFLPDYPVCPPLTGISSPTLLARICHEWREIALATPALWRAISFFDNDISMGQKIHLSDTWLTRSCSYPLSIRIDEDDGWSRVSQVLAAVIPHRARWEYMKLSLFPSHHLPAFQCSLPLLYHLDVELGESDEMKGITLQELPRLRSVVLNDIGAANIVLPWTQLTSLVLHQVYFRECIPILMQTTNLVYCELRLFRPLGENNDNVTLVLPCLQSLALNDPGLHPGGTYLGTFLVPALRSLRIPEKFLGSSPIDELTSFISKSQCTLQEVCITGKTLVPGDSYQKEFPSVPKFSFLPTFSSQYYDPMAGDFEE